MWPLIDRWEDQVHESKVIADKYARLRARLESFHPEPTDPCDEQTLRELEELAWQGLPHDNELRIPQPVRDETRRIAEEKYRKWFA